MSQNNIIFGCLIIAFLLYITAKGELATYIALLKGNGQQTVSTTSSSGNNSNPLQQGADLLTNSGVTGSPSTGNPNQDVLDLFGSNQPSSAQILDFQSGLK